MEGCKTDFLCTLNLNLIDSPSARFLVLDWACVTYYVWITNKHSSVQFNVLPWDVQKQKNLIIENGNGKEAQGKPPGL